MLSRVTTLPIAWGQISHVTPANRRTKCAGAMVNPTHLCDPTHLCSQSAKKSDGARAGEEVLSADALRYPGILHPRGGRSAVGQHSPPTARAAQYSVDGMSLGRYISRHELGCRVHR